MKKNQQKNSALYAVYCFIVLLFGGMYRFIRKWSRGKCGRKLQGVFTVLSVACLSILLVLPTALEQNHITMGQAILSAAALLLGFSAFAGMAGAFRPYQYMKKKQKYAVRKKIVPVSFDTSTQNRRTA